MTMKELNARNAIMLTCAWLVCGALAFSQACAHPQPNLTPAGQAIVTATQVVKALDIVRDTAIDLNAQTPPVLSTNVTRKIVNWHESAVKVILAVPTGWKATVLASLDQLQADLGQADWNRIAPYVVLVKTLIAEVG